MKFFFFKRKKFQSVLLACAQTHGSLLQHTCLEPLLTNTPPDNKTTNSQHNCSLFPIITRRILSKTKSRIKHQLTQQDTKLKIITTQSHYCIQELYPASITRDRIQYYITNPTTTQISFFIR